VRFTCAEKEKEVEDDVDSSFIQKGPGGGKNSWVSNIQNNLSGSFSSWTDEKPEHGVRDWWNTCLDLVWGRLTIRELIWPPKAPQIPGVTSASATLKSLGLRRMSQCYRQQEPLDSGTINLLFPDKPSMRDFKTAAQRCRDDLARATGVRRFFREQALARSKKGEKAAWRDFGYIMPGDEPEGEEVLAQLFERATELCCRKGDIIVAKGLTTKSLYHVQSGTVQLVSKRGEILHELGPGDLFGAESFMESGNMGSRHYAIATSHCQIMAITQEQVEAVCTSNPRAGARIFRNLAITLNLKLQVDLLAMKAWHRQ